MELENKIDDEKFIVDTAQKANWAIKTIKEDRERRDLFISVAKGEIDKLNQQIADVTKECDNSTSFLLYGLNDYMLTAPAKETKTQRKLSLPSGDIIVKLSKKDYSYDDANLLKWLKSNATDYVENKPKAKWGEFKKDLNIVGDMVVRKSTGETVECIKLIDIPESCEVK